VLLVSLRYKHPEASLTLQGGYDWKTTDSLAGVLQAATATGHSYTVVGNSGEHVLHEILVRSWETKPPAEDRFYTFKIIPGTRTSESLDRAAIQSMEQSLNNARMKTD